MRKFILVFFAIFIAGAACKKVSTTCGCSPAMGPELRLVVKNSAGDDLLNSKNAGYFAQGKIRLYKKDSNGNESSVYFTITPAPVFGNDFKYNTIHAYGFGDLLKSGKGDVYLKLGDEAPYTLNIQVDNNEKVYKLLLNNQEAEKDNGTMAKYASVFYLTR
jgi:hypothetical protein